MLAWLVLLGSMWFAPMGGADSTSDAPTPVEDGTSLLVSAVPRPMVFARQSDETAVRVYEQQPTAGTRARAAPGTSMLAGTQGYVNQNGVRMLGIPGRKQFDQNGGYCGEITIQMYMLKHGVWIPQSVARDAGGGELLPGKNYDRALTNLNINYQRFNGRGTQAFFAFAKQQLLQDRGVVTVAFLAGSRFDSYDHIMPIVGVKYTNPSSYDGNDLFYINNDYSPRSIERKASTYSCTAANRQPLDRAGCVNSATTWGYGMAGPKYLGIGPPLELTRLARIDEPGLGSNRSQNATLTARNLTPGAKYAVYNLTKGPNKGVKPSGQPFTSFTASGATWSTQVQLFSNKPAWFICVQTGGGPAGVAQPKAPPGTTPPAAPKAAPKQPGQQQRPPTSKKTCTVTVMGKQYDLTSFRHPGGQGQIKCGQDLTQQFRRKHGSSTSLLQRFAM